MCRTSTSNVMAKPITAFFDAPMDQGITVPAVPSAAVLSAVGMAMAPVPPLSEPVADPVFDDVKQLINKDGRVSALPIPACLNCRKSKVKCDGGIPCKRCKRMGTVDSCHRCEPKKRGRKRKSDAEVDAGQPQAETAMYTTSADVKEMPAAARRPRSSRKTSPKRSKMDATFVEPDTFSPRNASGTNVMLLDDFASLSYNFPSAASPMRCSSPSNEDYEARNADIFTTLCAQFRTWRDELISDVSADRASLNRFLWFTSHLSHLTQEFIDKDARSHASGRMLTPVSVQLCHTLAQDINAFVSSMGADACRLPQLDASTIDSLQMNVERQVYKSLPVGAACLPMIPLPFSARSTHRPWVNQALCSMLNSSPQSLSTSMSSLHSFLALLDPSSHADFLSALWRNVAAGNTTFATRLNWLTKSGHVVQLACDHALRYSNDVPYMHLIFAQVTDVDASSDDLDLLMPWGAADEADTFEFDNSSPSSSSSMSHRSSHGSESDSESTGYSSPYNTNAFGAMADAPFAFPGQTDMSSAFLGASQLDITSSSPDELALSIAAALDFIPPLYHSDALPEDTLLSFDDFGDSSSDDTSEQAEAYRKLASSSFMTDFDITGEPSIDVDRATLAQDSWTPSFASADMPAKHANNTMPFMTIAPPSSLADLLLQSEPLARRASDLNNVF